MPGIEDLMNIRTQGGTANAPPMPPPGMGGPPPGMGGPPMNAAYGRPLMRQSGGPLYRQGGGSMSDDDVLRQMIMDNLQKPEVQELAMEQAMGQSGRTMSDMGSRKRETIENLLRFTQG